MIFNKRLKIFSILLVLIALILTSCSLNFEQENANDSKKALTDLTASLETTVHQIIENQSFDNNFFEGFAKKHNFKLIKNTNNLILLSVEASTGLEDSPTLLLNCEFNNKQTENQQKNALGTILYILNNTEKHGKLKALITCNFNDNFDAFKNINLDNIQSDYFINILGDNKTYFYTGNASCENYLFTKDLHLVKPSCSHAYELSIQNLRGGNSGNISLHPNPIKKLGDFLAYAKSQGCIIELISFEGGEDSCNFPQGASVKFLINDNDIKKFERWFEKSSKLFKKQYGDVEPDYTYTFTPLEIPETVISQDDSTGIFTFLYTMINGVYSKEEGFIHATSNISKISTSNEKVQVKTCLRSIHQDILEEMQLTFKTISGLNDISFELINQHSQWIDNPENPLLNIFKTSFEKYTNKIIKEKTSMYTSSLTLLQNHFKNTPIVSISVNFDKGVTEVFVIQDVISEIATPTKNSQENNN